MTSAQKHSDLHLQFMAYSQYGFVALSHACEPRDGPLNFLTLHARREFLKQSGIEIMNDFLCGFIKGAKETPRAYFAPAVAVWRLLISTTNSLMSQRDVTNGE